MAAADIGRRPPAAGSDAVSSAEYGGEPLGLRLPRRKRLAAPPGHVRHLAPQLRTEDQASQRFGKLVAVADRTDDAGFRLDQGADSAAGGHRDGYAALERFGDRHPVSLVPGRQREQVGGLPQRFQMLPGHLTGEGDAL